MTIRNVVFSGINQGCGGTLNGATGRISSIDIDYDGRYENNQNCIWQIMADDGKVIKLTFSVFELEGPMAGICRYDFVEVSIFLLVKKSRRTAIPASDLC